jgi:hypothetical protein
MYRTLSRVRCTLLVAGLPLLLLLTGLAAPATVIGAELDACVRGQADVAKKVTDFHGESRIKQLIQADLDRAHREQAEGDTDECNEAIDHANKLLRGEY